MTANRKRRTKGSVKPDARLALGRARPDGEARFPVAPPKSEVPSGYGGALEELKKLVQETRLRAVLSANAAMIGLLLCRGKDKIVAEYALRDLEKPIGVADWKTKFVDKLPKELEGVLPTVEQIEAEFSPTKRKPRKS